MKCSCGDVMTVDAMTVEEAKGKIKEMMSVEMVAKHMAEKHVGEAVPSQEAVAMMIDQNTQEVLPMAA